VEDGFDDSSLGGLGFPILWVNVARAWSAAGAFLGSEAPGVSFSKNPRERSVPEESIIYIIFFIYIAFILKKTCRKTN
jgi:hypothetical protein